MSLREFSQRLTRFKTAIFCSLNYFTQQHTPPGQQGQASHTQTPVWQQPQSQTQQQELPQQLPAHAGAAMGAAIEENNEASRKVSVYIRNLQQKWQI